MTVSDTTYNKIIHKSPRKPVVIPDDVTLADLVLNQGLKVDNLNYPCFTDAVTNESVSHEELRDTVPKVASGLHNNFGIVKDDIVGVFAPNHVNFGACMLGIVELGAIFSAANYVYTPSELSHLLKLVQPKVLITVPELLEVAQKAIAESELNNINIAFLSNDGCQQNPDIPNFKQILSDKPYPKLSFSNTEQSKEQAAAVLFSSGTTGVPKGVMLSHYNLISNMFQGRSVLGHYYKPKDTFISVLPFFHVFALMVDLLLIVHGKCSTYIIKRFDLKTYLEIIDKNIIRIAFVAPPVLVAFAKHPMVKNYNTSNLKLFLSGAAPLSKELEDEIFAKLGIQCTQGFGMSELSPISHVNDISDKRSGSIGYTITNMELVIVDVETGEYLGTNKRGELRVKGPNVMIGYYKNEQATKDMFDEDGFMKTGDIAYIDDDGYVYIVDRLKELIKVKGFQVPPAELEALLLTHPDVADACVIGVPDKASGELPKGFITLKNPEATNIPEIVESIHDYFGEKLAHYKQLKGGIEIIKQIPKSPSGKILRRVLRDI